MSELQDPKSTGSLPYWRSDNDWPCFHINTPFHLNINNIENRNALLFPATVYVQWDKIFLQKFCFSFLLCLTSTEVFTGIVTFTVPATIKTELWRIKNGGMKG